MPHSFEVSGALTSPADPRDYKDSKVRELTTGSGLPVHQNTNMNALALKVPVLYQGTTPACIPHSSTWLFQYKYYLENSIFLNLSPRMGYAADKAHDGVPNVQGTYPRTDLQEFATLGRCSTTDFPNDVTLPLATYQNDSLIPAQGLVDALRYSGLNYISVGLDADSIRAAIDDWGGVLACVKIGIEWWTNTEGQDSWLASEILPVRTPATVISQHQIAIYGYDTEYFYFANSFGDAWGNNGFGYFSITDYLPFFVENWAIEALPQDVVKGLQTVVQETQPSSPTTTQSIGILQQLWNWLTGL